jgi:hypothetical protein
MDEQFFSKVLPLVLRGHRQSGQSSGRQRMTLGELFSIRWLETFHAHITGCDGIITNDYSRVCFRRQHKYSVYPILDMLGSNFPDIKIKLIVATPETSFVMFPGKRLNNDFQLRIVWPLSATHGSARAGCPVRTGKPTHIPE